MHNHDDNTNNNKNDEVNYICNNTNSNNNSNDNNNSIIHFNFNSIILYFNVVTQHLQESVTESTEENYINTKKNKTMHRPTRNKHNKRY